MLLEDYFEYLDPLDIRLRGTRMDIDTILHEYLDWFRSAEEIVTHYPTITLEQVYAVLTYYWRYPDDLQFYLRMARREAARQRQDQDEKPSPGILRLRAIQAAREYEQAMQDLQRPYPPPAIAHLRDCVPEPQRIAVAAAGR